MKDHISAFGQTFHPDVVEMLQRVLHQARKARGILSDRKASEDLARTVVELFEHGVRDEARLNMMVNAIR